MSYLDITKNKLFIGSSDKLEVWSSDGLKSDQIIQKIKLLLKNYLELDNVSFLFGTGTSIHLGAVSIRNFPVEIETKIKEKEIEEGFQRIYNDLIEIIKNLQYDFLSKYIEEISSENKLNFTDERGWEFVIDKNGVIRDVVTNEIYIEFERIMNYLLALNYIQGQEKPSQREDKTELLIQELKAGLFNVCNIDKKKLSVSESEKIKTRRGEDVLEKIIKNKYYYHERFVKALLQRPLNLRRANIFTSNYDLAFEYTFDKLGVFYIDGFAGFHKRFFKPETFEYDIFYPGSTTAGKVQRIEKVVRYFKLHGSISWVSSEKRGSNNLYGIEEKPIELINNSKNIGDLIIYPSAVKKSFTLDLPYSELFRQFATTINQSQSVLFTIGYSFGDEHFNDIIYQALSNPTFTLIVVDLGGTKSPYIKELLELNDPRIIILEGELLGDFISFADSLMPDFNNIDNEIRIANTLNTLFKNDNGEKKTIEAMPAISNEITEPNPEEEVTK